MSLNIEVRCQLSPYVKHDILKKAKMFGFSRGFCCDNLAVESLIVTSPPGCQPATRNHHREKDGLSRLMRQISRRTFLKLAAISTTAAALYKSTGSILHALSYVNQITFPGEGVSMPSVCQLCPAECGIRVRVVEGMAVKIDGSLQNPNNQGRTCPKGQAALQLLYNPDRIQTPLKRVGERGEGQWQAISWQEAVEAVASRLRDIRQAGTPERIAFLTNRPPGLLGETIAYFCRALGTPNAIDLHTDARRQALLLTQGWAGPPGYDLDRTRYLLSFSSPLLEWAQPTVRWLRAYSYIRRGRPGNRGRIVQIDPRFSVTASKADEWVPIKPGTEGALAFGLAWVILRERLYDADFVSQHGYGFEPWRDAVLASYSPAQVTTLTGVPEKTIRRLAREFAGMRPAIAVAGEGVGQQANGLASQLAIHTLNALIGSIDVPGGVVMQRKPPLQPWPEIPPDDASAQDMDQPRLDGSVRFPLVDSVPHRLPDNLLTGKPYPVEALLTYWANPLHDSPAAGLWREALKKLPFIVSFDPFIEETSAYADYVLPDHTFLERWIAAPLAPSLGYPVLALGRPVVEPLYDTQSFGDTLIQLAREAGEGPGSAFPWPDYSELLRFRLEGLRESERGSIRSTTAAAFWQELTTRGVWVDSPYRFASAPEAEPDAWQAILATPSGKFEFTPQVFETQIPKQPPYYEPPRFEGEGETYPFHLHLYTLMAQASGPGAANLPHLHELYGLQFKEMWGNWVEIHPEAAHELRIKDGDEVWVESPMGRIRLPVRLFEGAQPEVVNIPAGLGHTADGRWAQGIGANPEKLIRHHLVDELTGIVARQGMRVKVYPVGAGE
jgi:anaerobic selenocysteine-containing dehydrogenase